MAFSEIETAKIQNTMDAYIERIRPKPEIRAQLDIAYRILDQSIEIFEIRPDMDGRIMHSPIAKTIFVRANKLWKIFWMRSDLKWHGYETKSVKTLDKFLEIVEADEYCCFWG